MLRTHFHIPIIPLVILGLALFATAVLVVNVIRPEYIPVQYSVAKEAPLSPALNRVQKADVARWQGWAVHYQVQRARQADTGRWHGWVDYYLAASAQPTLSRSQLADVARWEKLAIDYILMKSALSPAQMTEALRWTALAIHYGSAPDHISPLMRILLDQ